jgi:hypothetical protein
MMIVMLRPAVHHRATRSFACLLLLLLLLLRLMVMLLFLLLLRWRLRRRLWLLLLPLLLLLLRDFLSRLTRPASNASAADTSNISRRRGRWRWCCWRRWWL